jgi:hypothetical protein
VQLSPIGPPSESPEDRFAGAKQWSLVPIDPLMNPVTVGRRYAIESQISSAVTLGYSRAGSQPP